MLTRVDVLSENPFYLNIRDARPTDSIVVQKIEGLGPPDIDLFMGDYARDGGFYSGRRVPPRDVTFWLGYNPNYAKDESVSGLRAMLYKAFLDPFSQSDSVNIVLKDDELADRYLSGYTSKFEGDIFSDDTTTQVVMRFPNPYLIDVNTTRLVGAGPSIPFEYKGTAEVGLIATAAITVNSSWLKLDLNGSVMVLNFAFLVDDQVLVDTRRGQRKIQVTRGGVTTDILYALVSSPSSWLDIHSAQNTFKLYGINQATIVANLTDLKFQAQHWGI